MNSFRKKQRFVVSTILIIMLVTSTFLPFDLNQKAEAKTSSEIADEISAKQKELSDLQSKLNSLNSQTSVLNSQAYGLSGSLASVQNELKKVENEIEINKLKVIELETEKQLKQLDIEKRKNDLNNKLYDFYVLSHSENDLSLADSLDMDHYWTSEKYMSLLISKEKGNIDNLSKQVLGITSDIARFEKSKKDFEKQGEELDAKKKDLSAQLAQLNGSIYNNNQQGSTLKNQIASTQDRVKQLENEYKAMLEQEKQKMNGATVEEIVDLKPGQYYFSGKLRDLSNGHYVGMSQWGSYGMGKAGKSYSDILKKFYTGVQVTNSAVSDEGTIWVSYCKSSPLYDTPPCAKGSSDYVLKSMKIKDYLANLSEIPSSWPVESQKAQMVAARTYALKNTNNGSSSSPICTTAQCQAVNPDGSGGFSSIVSGTANKVVTYNGALISALYTSSACGHTEDNDKIFSDYSGNGTAYPYLRSVDYSEYYSYWHSAQVAMNGGDKKDPCNYREYSNEAVGWRTNGYSLSDMSAKVNIILSHYGKSSIGNLQSMTLVRTSAGHVWKVQLKGSAGSQTLSGYWFKHGWNYYVPGINHPNFIYGLDFSFKQAT
ncbi:SpoIID/LytB domain-containing protein [Candidatus Dojkabacteria bacterium]|uniref:SpoIID/LytB domain-containing protein n=1 Tax=Candidatus Dojkabacteria bacterium TaxID=2099670 RepID=A0A955L2T0_9BACT|nr:SpoIID/LytB domain-containing protein [Candidatus Dojkabacteria bacterium]